MLVDVMISLIANLNFNGVLARVSSFTGDNTQRKREEAELQEALEVVLDSI